MDGTNGQAPDQATMRRPWRKSSFSDPDACVEAGMLSNGTAVVRNSDDHSQGTLHFGPSAMAALVDGAKAGEFDDLAQA